MQSATVRSRDREAVTSDRALVVGIAPLLAGREDAFAERDLDVREDAAQIIDDYAAMKDRDLAALIASPGGT